MVIDSAANTLATAGVVPRGRPIAGAAETRPMERRMARAAVLKKDIFSIAGYGRVS